MSRATESGYSFAEGVPIEPVDRGSTLLVAGPAFSRAEDLARSMVADGAENGEGTLFISTNMTCEKLLGNCEETHPGFDVSRAGVIDCSGQDLGETRFRAQVKMVSTQSDLTGIGMKFSSLYESLYADAADGRVRTGLISLSSLSMYVDMRALFRFAQTLSGRIDSAEGLGVFAIDPTTHDERVVNTLSQVADARVQVRDGDGPGDELRVQGITGKTGEWQSFTL